MVHNPSFIDSLTCAVCARFEANNQRRATGMTDGAQSLASNGKLGKGLGRRLLCTNNCYNTQKILCPTKYDK